MSTYYNFRLIDLTQYKEPPRDSDGAYDFGHDFIESVNPPEIQDTSKNNLASGLIDLFYNELKQVEEEEKKKERKYESR